MNWFALASAVGIGTIIAKVIDVKLLQPYLAKTSRSDWLRDKRLQSFSRLTQNLLAFGYEEPGQLKTPWEHYAIAAEALLLIDDRNLCDRIDQFIVKRTEMETESDNGNSQKAEVLYSELAKEARELVVALRKELRNDCT